MGETAEERRLRQLGGESMYRVYYPTEGPIFDTNPCSEIMIGTPQRCTLGYKPLIKYNEYKFNF
jgi:hypothetical protein